jgi:hypothetical protein
MNDSECDYKQFCPTSAQSITPKSSWSFKSEGQEAQYRRRARPKVYVYLLRSTILNSYSNVHSQEET